MWQNLSCKWWSKNWLWIRSRLIFYSYLLNFICRIRLNCKISSIAYFCSFLYLYYSPHSYISLISYSNLSVNKYQYYPIRRSRNVSYIYDYWNLSCQSNEKVHFSYSLSIISFKVIFMLHLGFRIINCVNFISYCLKEFF